MVGMCVPSAGSRDSVEGRSAEQTAGIPEGVYEEDSGERQNLVLRLYLDNLQVASAQQRSHVTFFCCPKECAFWSHPGAISGSLSMEYKVCWKVTAIDLK
jgi:hypothetical protein